MATSIEELKMDLMHLKKNFRRLNTLKMHKRLCPICHWEGDKFYDTKKKYGGIYKDSTCPNCHSQPRHRMLFLYLKKILPKCNKIKLLHFAPEPFIAKLIKNYRNIKYLSADIDRNKAMKKEDITHLSFEDNTFDIIICSHVLEHVEDDKKAFNEIHRVLKHKGIAIIIVPLDNSREITHQNPEIKSEIDREREYGWFEHLRLYGNDFKNIAEEQGLLLKEIISMKDFTEKDSYLYGLGKDFIFAFIK